MARHLRVEFPGAIYHVTCRMVGDAPSLRSYGGTSWRTEKTLMFKDDADHERFVERLAERVEQFNIRLYLFVCTCPQCYSVAVQRRPHVADEGKWHVSSSKLYWGDRLTQVPTTCCGSAPGALDAITRWSDTAPTATPCWTRR